jgi:hypothetical protein
MKNSTLESNSTGYSIGPCDELLDVIGKLYEMDLELGRGIGVGVELGVGIGVSDRIGMIVEIHDVVEEVRV